MNGWQENLRLEILQKGGYPGKNVGHTNLSTIWNWPLRFNPWQRAQFRNPWYNENNFSNGGTLNKKLLFTNSDTVCINKHKVCYFFNLWLPRFKVNYVFYILFL